MKRSLVTILLLLVAAMLKAQTEPIRLSVEECVNMARENSADCKNATLAVSRAEAVREEARAAYFPKISAQAFALKSYNPLLEIGIADIDNALLRQYAYALVNEYGALWGGDESISISDGGWMANLTAIQPVYVGGRVRNSNKLAKLGVKASQLLSQTHDDTVSMQTETLCWTLIALQEKAQTIEMLSTLLDTLQKDVVSASEAGLITPAALTKVNLKKSECELNRKKLNDGITLLKMALAQTLGIEDWNAIALTDTLGGELPPDSYLCDAHTAVELRNETQLLNLSVEAQQLQKRLIIGEALPTLMVGGSLNYHTFLNTPSKNMIAFAMLQIPITDWHKTAFRIKQHNIDIEAEQNKRNDLVEKMTLQTEQAWFNLQQSWLQIELAQKNADDARQNLKTTQDFYNAGMLPLSDLLEAQTLYKNAMDELADSRSNYRISLLKYKQLTGPF